MTMPFVQMTKVEFFWVETLQPILLARLSNLMIQTYKFRKIICCYSFFTILSASASSNGYWLDSNPLPWVNEASDLPSFKGRGFDSSHLCWLW